MFLAKLAKSAFACLRTCDLILCFVWADLLASPAWATLDGQNFASEVLPDGSLSGTADPEMPSESLSDLWRDGEEVQAMTTELLQYAVRHDRAGATGRRRTSTTTTTTWWNCISDTNIGVVAASERKGIALDDSTFSECPDKIPRYWPNTEAPIQSVRLFKVWNLNKEWYPEEAYGALKRYAEQNNVRFLLGASLTCDERADDEEWEAAKGFVRYVGARHIMGLAIGNELDIQVGGQDRYPECVDNLWRGGRYFRTLVSWVEDFDRIDGMSSLPITTVISAKGLSDDVKHLFSQAWDRFGTRFVASFNIYPQFSDGLAQAGCEKSVLVGVKFDTTEPAGFVPNVGKYFRQQLNVNGWSDMRLWVTEVGWHTHGSCALKCDLACKNPDAQKDFYRNFIKWDMTVGMLEETAAPAIVDHVFYFTLRDSDAFGETEAFGIMGNCSDARCKF